MQKSPGILKAGLSKFAAVPFELLDDPTIMSAIDIAVFTALRRFADFRDGDRCFPSIARIAAVSRCSRRAVQESLRRLEASGWIAVRLGTGRGHPSQYVVRLSRKGAPNAPFIAETVHQARTKDAPGAPEQDTKNKKHSSPIFEMAPADVSGTSAVPRWRRSARSSHTDDPHSPVIRDPERLRRREQTKVELEKQASALLATYENKTTAQGVPAPGTEIEVFQKIRRCDLAMTHEYSAPPAGQEKDEMTPYRRV